MVEKMKQISGGKLLTGIVLSILTYWLFAQSFLNIGPQIQSTFGASPGIVNISISLTFFGTSGYIVVALIASVFFGGGTGLFATPALSTAVSTTPPEKVGVASGIFKMGSTLGGAFGIAIMISIYTAIMQSGQSLHTAATAGFIVGACIVGCGVLASALIIPTRKINS